MTDIKIDCKDKMKKEFEFISDEDLTAVEQDILEIVGANPDRKSLNKAMQDYVDKAEHDLKYASARVVRDMIKTKRINDYILSAPNLKEASRRLLDVFEGDNSIFTMYTHTRNRYTNQLIGSLLEKDLKEVFFTGELDELVFLQAQRKAKGMPDVDDPRAVKVYDAVKKVNDQIYEEMRMAGLDVKYRKDFLLSRGWDTETLIEKGEDAFVDFMLGREGKDGVLDIEQTFAGDIVTNREKQVELVRRMYNEHLESRLIHSTDSDLHGRRSYLHKLKGRKLEFKEGGEYKFFTEYGRGDNLAQGMINQIDRSAKTVSNTMQLGTNPSETFDRMKGAFEKKYIAEGENPYKAIEKAQEAFNEVVAPKNRPASTVDTIVGALRSLNSFSKLGSSIFAAAFDINPSAMQYSLRTGDSQASSYIKAFNEFIGLARMSGAERREVLSMLETMSYVVDPAMYLGGHAGDFGNGFNKMNQIMNGFYKWTGVPWQTEVSRATNGMLASNALYRATHAKTGNPFQLELIKDYNITAKEIDILRQVKTDVGPKEWIPPKAIRELDLKMFHENPTVAAKMRADLANKAANFVNDHVYKGTPMGTAKTKRQMGKASSDPRARAAANLIMQFKETAWKIAYDNIEAYNKFAKIGGRGRANKEVFMYMMTGAMSYMMIDSAKRSLFNQESIWEQATSDRDNAIRNLMFDYINRSSILPVISDGIDASTSPYWGDNLLRYSMGPTAGMIQDAAKIRDERGAFRFFKRHVGPMNHFGIKALERHVFGQDFSGQKIRK
jgi:hypothetical protein